MSAFELVGIFVVALLAGIAVGYFLRVALKVSLVFIGFYILVTFALWWFGIITINIDLGMITESIKGLVSSLLHGSTRVLTQKEIVTLIGFLIGVYLGFRHILK